MSAGGGAGSGGAAFSQNQTAKQAKDAAAENDGVISFGEVKKAGPSFSRMSHCCVVLMLWLIGSWS